MTALRCYIRLAIGLSVLSLTGAARAQENLDQGKTPAQLFASNCAICHKSPQGLAKGGGLFGLDSFLREHYTASKESASALAAYIRAMDTGPAAPGRSGKRSARGDEKKKPGSKPGEAKGTERKPDPKPGEALSSERRTSEPRPPSILAPERKPGETKSAPPAAGEAKPAEGGKSEKPQ
jgi:hypothetical protein